MELIHWADEVGGYLIEDDYDGEFRYQGKPIPSLQGLDEQGNVIYLGTFSKSLFPSIGISYMVLPQSLLSGYHDKFALYKQTVPRAQQYTLARFMQEGHWNRHLNRIRNHYKKKHALLLKCIADTMGEHVHITNSESGMHILLQVKSGVRSGVENGASETELLRSALQQGVRVYPISAYYSKAAGRIADEALAGSPLILIGFGGIASDDIPKGIAALKRAWVLD
jgi:GntR family transcriptional regulator/MocR family aminotransferase